MLPGARVGHVLASKYRLEELLGSGGMGDVYRATNIEIDRAVAIKVLRAEHASNTQLVDRFLREARAANLVRHPNVVDVVDVGRDADGSPFIVQELLTGEDLAKYVERRGGRLTVDEIGELLLPVIDAVAEAHARGVVHRDIKPENVFIAEQGKQRVPKLLDFGISKLRLPNIKATEVGMMMGTPAYMAPEQVQGSSQDADPRTDVWALGIVLYELLAGRLPFPAEDAPALFVAIATKDVPPLIQVVADVPPSLARVVARCVRRAPAERYPSALELARDLRHVLEGDEIEPTQRRSILPPRAPLPDLVPDLVIPANPGKVAATTVKGPPPDALGKTELSHRAPRSSGRVVASAPVPELGPPPPPRSSARLAAAAPASSREPAPPPPIAPPLEPLAGVMFAPAASTGRRPPVAAHAPRPAEARAGGADMAQLIAIAVVVLTAVGLTAVLMTVAYRPDGWPLVAAVSRPSPAVNLAVQGALAALAFGIGVRAVTTGVKAWRGDVSGGKAAALVQAALAGGAFFAMLQLARAAW